MSDRTAPRPLLGRYAMVMPSGVIWAETIRYRAKDARQAMAEIFIGWQVDGKKIETTAEALTYAKKRGHRIIKVDVYPAGGHQP